MGPRIALALFVTLAALQAQGLKLEASSGVDKKVATEAEKVDKAENAATEGQGEGGLTLEGRKAAHAQLFEKDFTVELDMAQANAEGLDMGVQLDTDTDFTPVSVMKIRKTGLLELWNQANPDNAVHLGDQIMRVNDILWHHNSRTFAERIKSQYKHARAGVEGAKPVLTLYVQRPRKQDETRFKSQREDLRRQLYSKEFVADIPFAPGHDMGWELNASQDWLPLTISKLNQSGLVGLWNKEHPEFRIYPGDEITKANNIAWHHNSKVFANHIKGQFAAKKAGKVAGSVAMSLMVQRPRSVVEELEDKTFQRTLTITVPYDTFGMKWGWSLQANEIASIDNASLLDRWNKGHPAMPLQRLEVGDRILQVNRAQWQNHQTNFASKVKKVLEAAREASASVTMIVQRPHKVSYTKGWLVEIPAKVGQNLGLQLTVDDDDLPVSIGRIRTLGAVQMFNEDNPEDAVMPGDHVFKVNDNLWRENSIAFAKNLESQFTRSKRVGTMNLWVQRPEGLESESADQGSPDYVQYSVELPVPSSKAMGWDLNSTEEGVPVSIKKVLNAGSVFNWNLDNPVKDIQAGDQLIQVDRNSWQNNTRNFMQRLTKQLDDASKGVGKKSISVLFRRPFHVVDPTGKAGDEEKLGIGEEGIMGAEE